MADWELCEICGQIENSFYHYEGGGSANNSFTHHFAPHPAVVVAYELRRWVKNLAFWMEFSGIKLPDQEQKPLLELLDRFRKEEGR